MRLRNGMMIVAIGGLLAAAPVYAQHNEQDDDGDEGQETEVAIKRSDLPPAVEKTAAAESAHATVKGFAREVENGVTYYEMELVVDGHARDVLMDADGNVVEIEEQVAFERLPATVQTALKARAGKGKIGVVESLTKRGSLVAYEAHIVTGRTRSEVQVGPNGETLDHEE